MCTPRLNADAGGAGGSEEIETYRRLLPTPRSISATLFLEFADLATVHRDLDGVQHLIRLHAGDDVIARRRRTAAG